MDRVDECPCCGGSRCAVTYCFRMQATAYPTRGGGYVWKTKGQKMTGWQCQNGGNILKIENGVRGVVRADGGCVTHQERSIERTRAQGQFDWGNDCHGDPTA